MVSGLVSLLKDKVSSVVDGVTNEKKKVDTGDYQIISIQDDKVVLRNRNGNTDHTYPIEYFDENYIDSNSGVVSATEIGNKEGVYFPGNKGIYGGLHDKILGFVSLYQFRGDLLKALDNGKQGVYNEDGELLYGLHDEILDFIKNADGEDLLKAKDEGKHGLYREDGSLVEEFGGQHDQILYFVKHPDGRTLLIAKDDEKCSYYEADGKAIFGSHERLFKIGSESNKKDLYKLLDGEVVIKAWDNGKYGFYNEDGEVRFGLYDDIILLLKHPNGKQVVEAKNNGRVGYYRKDGSLVEEFGGQHDGTYGFVDNPITGEYLLLAVEDGRHILYSKDGSVVKELNTEEVSNTFINSERKVMFREMEKKKD